MKTKFLLIFFISLVFNQVVYAQNVKRALNQLEKQDFQKLEEYLRKSIEKDSINPVGHYLFSLLFVENNSTLFNLDSAYKSIQLAINQLEVVDPKDREKIEKNDVTRDEMLQTRSKVDKLIFDRTKEINTEDAFNTFLENHPHAIQYEEGISIRNQLAYNTTSQIHTFQAYKNFMEKYPDAEQVPEARKHYDVLVFEANTQEQTLKNYRSFLTQFPNTPYRNRLEQQILELTTIGNNPEDYIAFIDQYPNSKSVKLALNLLFFSYLHSGMSVEDAKASIAYPQADSLRNSFSDNASVIFPVYTSGSTLFLDNMGDSLILVNGEVLRDYFCDGVNENILLTDPGIEAKVITRKGITVRKGKYDMIKKIRPGFFLTSFEDKKGILLESGQELIEPQYDNITSEGPYFIVEYEGKKGLFSSSGRKLLNPDHDEISIDYEFIVLFNGSGYALLNSAELEKSVQEDNFNFSFKFDDFLVIDENHILGIVDNREGLFDKNLNALIPLNTYRIEKKNFGWTSIGVKDYTYYNQNYRIVEQQQFENIQVKYGWEALKAGSTWRLAMEENGALTIVEFDSVRIINKNAAYIEKEGKSGIYFRNNKTVPLDSQEHFQLVSSNRTPDKDTQLIPEYLIISDRSDRNQTIYDMLGNDLFVLKNNRLDFVYDSLFIVERNNRKGIVDAEGKTLVSSRYSAIGKNSRNTLSLLNGEKFGLYSIMDKKTINPEYTKALTPFNDKFFIAYQSSGAGIIDIENHTLTDFENEEIFPWNDSVAFVKSEGEWRVLNTNGEPLLNISFSNFESRPGKSGRRAIVYSNNGYGVIDHAGNMIIPASFSDIVIIGNEQEWIYFCEKYIKEAGIYVVIYYDETGKKITYKVYEETIYDDIYCDQ